MFFIFQVNELATFGGRNAYKFVKRAVSALVDDNLLKEFSWLGRKGKRPFNKHLTAKVVVGE